MIIHNRLGERARERTAHQTSHRLGQTVGSTYLLTQENGSHPCDDPGGKCHNHTYDAQHARLTRGPRLETIPQTILIALTKVQSTWLRSGWDSRKLKFAWRWRRASGEPGGGMQAQSRSAKFADIAKFVRIWRSWDANHWQSLGRVASTTGTTVERIRPIENKIFIWHLSQP